MFWNALVTAIPFLSFKGTTHAYFLKTSMTNNENQIPFKPVVAKLDLFLIYNDSENEK